MSLHWEEAKVIVTCGGAKDLEDVPEDAIVITLKPEEADDPEAVEAVRNLVLDRTIEQRRRTISKFYEEGTSMPEPLVEGGAAEGGQDEASEAERRLLEALRARSAADDQVTSPLDDSDCWGGTISPASMGDLLLGEGTSRGVRIFIGRVEELVVHN